MDVAQVGMLLVVGPDTPPTLVGLVTDTGLLRARRRPLVEERHTERVLTLIGRPRRARTALGAASER